MTSKLKSLIPSLLIAALGAYMIKNPSLLAGPEPQAKRTGILNSFINLWGLPVGIIFLFLGIGMAYSIWQSEPTEENPED